MCQRPLQTSRPCASILAEGQYQPTTDTIRHRMTDVSLFLPKLIVVLTTCANKTSYKFHEVLRLSKTQQELSQREKMPQVRQGSALLLQGIAISSCLCQLIGPDL